MQNSDCSRQRTGLLRQGWKFIHRRGLPGRRTRGRKVDNLPFLWKVEVLIHMRFHEKKSFVRRTKCGYPQHPQLYGYYVYLTLFYCLISFYFPGDNETCAAR